MKSSSRKRIFIGHMKFKSNFTEEICSEILAKKDQKFLIQSEWVCSSKIRFDTQWDQLFSYIDGAQFETITIKGFSKMIKNERKVKLLQRIVVPEYSNLWKICISACEVTNIESLNFWNARRLAILQLKDSRVTNVSTLNKLRWKNLASISLSGKFTNEICMSRSTINPAMRKFQLSGQKNQNIEDIGRDLSFIAKLPIQQHSKKTSIIMNPKLRINQQKVKTVLKKKIKTLCFNDVETSQA